MNAAKGSFCNVKKRKYRRNQHSESKRKKSINSAEDLGNGCSASTRKIPAIKTTNSFDGSPDCKEPNKESTISGFRFVDMTILSSVFRSRPCKYCFVFDLILQDQAMERMCLESSFTLLHVWVE